MNVLFNLIVVVQVVSALAIIGLVLVQHGKGADMGAAFGSGASGSLFGASGSSNFLSKSTAVAAAIFFASTLTLAYFGSNRPHASVGGGVMEHVTVPVHKAPAGAGDAVPATTPAPAPAAGAPAAPAPSATQDVPGVATPAAPAPAPAK
ncbi:preprotein translocase subunit SecG [Massilia sp. Root335]|jgi:preprotein translocase subunit SecG|uniref:preprotein translocase subunit SecG n=1 Tax=Massilia sp. Root335 TaxID=1736517 RepID=UPI0006F74557|nr:preprotein translocase subunit SecG [Massilia sp. Root335]KQV52324.1 preprotein translocase subunit SecG [Massilia sp. Root335]